MAAPVFVQAWKGLVSINSNPFNVLQADCNWTTPLEDITYTTPGFATYAIKLPGYISGSGTLTFVYDTANQPTVSPQNMLPQTLMTVILYPEGTKPFTFSAYSGSFTFSTGPQAGVSVKCTTNWESTGVITFPTS